MIPKHHFSITPLLFSLALAAVACSAQALPLTVAPVASPAAAFAGAPVQFAPGVTGGAPWPVDSIWVDDALPAGATTFVSGGDTWTWVTANPAPQSGTKSHQSETVPGYHRHAFFNATASGMAVVTGDLLVTWVYLDPANPTREIMLRWNDGDWGQGAYWGENLINEGTDGTSSRRYAGPLPPAGQWVRLTVPASQVGMVGKTASGMMFALYDGRAAFDTSGKGTSPHGLDFSYLWDFGDGSTSTQASPAHTYSQTGSFTVQLTVTDSLGVAASQSFTLGVTNNAPPTDISLAPASIPENSASGTVVGSFSTSDSDPGETFAYTLLDSAGGRFAIAGGQLVVSDGSLLDFEFATSHTIRVRSTDRGGTGLSFEKNLVIAVSDVFEVPVATTASEDIAYAPASDYPYGNRLLDVYAPAKPGPHPVLVWVHGGSWRYGDKAFTEFKDDVFLDAGYVFVSVNYRLAADYARNPTDPLIGVIRFEDEAADVAAAIAWVATHIRDYGGDPQRIHLMGHSAGAHLISLVSTDESYLAAHGVPLSFIRAVISLDTPMYNLPLLDQDKPVNQYWTDLAGTTQAEWQHGSPSFHVAAGKGIPPFYVAYTHGATLDDPALAWRINQCNDFTTRLAAAAVPFDLRGHPELTHGEITVNFGTPGDVVTAEAFAFLATLTAANDDTYWLSSRTAPLSVNAANGLLKNDTKPSGTLATASLATAPAHGTAVVNADGSFTYTPDPAWTGDDFFTYTSTFPARPASTARVTLRTGIPDSLADVEMKSDYYAADYPSTDPLYGATEANALEVHNGMLYCASSYFPASGGLSGVDPKILVKRSASGPWEVDYRGTSRFARFGCLKSVRFTSDANGAPLPRPVPVLFAGTGQWRYQNFQYITIMTRVDASATWVATDISTDVNNPNSSNDTQELRVIFDHVDRVTGIHSVYAGTTAGNLFRGVYDPAQPGLVRWESQPDIDDCYGRFLSATEANGVLYAGLSIDQNKDMQAAAAGAPLEKRAGIYRRIDGVTPSWQWVNVPGWANVASNIWASMEYLRGITAVPHPAGSNSEVLLCGQLGVDLDGNGLKQTRIERIDPANGFAVTTELDVGAFLNGVFGKNVPVISGMPYNEMTPTTHPDTGDPAVLIGAWFRPESVESTEAGKKSWYLVRNNAGTYELGEIWDAAHPLTGATYGLRGSRSIRPSPFPEDRGRVWYFCGFDQTDTSGGAKGPTAWIYRGHLPLLSIPPQRLDLATLGASPRLMLQGTDGGHYQLEYSTDLLTWQPWHSLILNGGTWQTDVSIPPGLTRGFWRSRQLWTP
jgi:acetyl esterase/lipase